MDIGGFEEHLAADHNISPELLFDRKWALAVVRQATELLQAEYQRQNKCALFVALSSCLQGDAGPGNSYSQVGQTLGLSSGAVKVAVYRLRQRYRELLRAVVAQTVNDPREIDDEVRHLVEVLTL